MHDLLYILSGARRLKGALLLVIATFLFHVNLNAQSDFREGFYITNSFDTIYGLIDYRGDIRNARQCMFKKDSVSKAIVFKPFEIYSYRFVGSKYYVSKEVSVLGKKDSVFLEFLVDGVADLYYFRDISGDHYYVQNRSDTITELVSLTKKHVEGVGDVQKPSNKYIGLLKVSFSDCMEIQPDINNTKLTHQSLIDITKTYHDYTCDGEKCIVYEKMKKDPEFRIACFSGVNVSKGTFESNRLLYPDFSSDISFFPSFGAEITYSLPKLNEKLFLEAVFDVSKSYYYSSHQEKLGDDIITYYDMHTHTAQIRALIGAGYVFGSGNIRPRLGFGLNLIFFQNNNIRIMKETDFNYAVYASEYKLNLPPGGFRGAYVLTGLEYSLSKRLKLFSDIRMSFADIDQCKFYTYTQNFGLFIIL